MRVPIQYVALALSSGLGYSASGPSAVEVTASTSPSCWAPSRGVSASYGPLNDL